MASITEIGKYQVVDRLAQGGMGTLYLARDPMLERLVAIKVLRLDVDWSDIRERFAREARSVSRLRHPNIVTIFEYGDHQGQPYLVMEYISGQSMADVIRERVPLPVNRKLELMEQLCAGLAYAHRARIVHRDIKPANLMIDEESGALKILDFGIARNLESNATRLTHIVGTPSYMSPEQATGGPVDERTDIFAVACVFYELLSYRRAFDGDSPMAVMQKVANQDPVPVTILVRGLDPAIGGVVARAMQRDPARRYQNLDALRADIARAQQHSPALDGTTEVVPAPAVSPQTGSRRTLDAFDLARLEEENRRAGEAIAVARRQFDRGEHAAAIAALERFEPAHTAVSAVAVALRLELAALEARARAAAERQRFEDEMRRVPGHDEVHVAESRTASLDAVGPAPVTGTEQRAIRWTPLAVGGGALVLILVLVTGYVLKPGSSSGPEGGAQPPRALTGGEVAAPVPSPSDQRADTASQRSTPPEPAGQPPPPPPAVPSRDADPRLAAARAAFQRRDFIEAGSLYQRVLSDRPDNAAALAGVRAVGVALERQRRAVDVYVTRGDAFRADGLYDDAIQAYEAALTEDPANAVALQKRNDTRLAKDRAGGAAVAMPAKPEAAPPSSGSMQTRERLLRQANGLLDASLFDAAIAAFDELLKMNPSDSEAVAGREKAVTLKGRPRL